MTHSKPNKILFYIRRYFFPELVSLAVSYSLAWSVEIFGWGNVASAYAGSFGAFVGFYVPIIIRDYFSALKSSDRRGKALTKEILRDLLIEFGAAESLDLFIIRPACLITARLVSDEFLIYMFVGNGAANTVFFGVAAVMHNYKTMIAKKTAGMIKGPK